MGQTESCAAEHLLPRARLHAVHRSEFRHCHAVEALACAGLPGDSWDSVDGIHEGLIVDDTGSSGGNADESGEHSEFHHACHLKDDLATDSTVPERFGRVQSHNFTRVNQI